jgi:penicillin-binding protein 2
VRIYEDLRVVQSRLGIVQTVLVALLVLLGAQFWYLQVLRHREFKQKADTIQIRPVRIAAPRGALLDRNGRILVENRPSFNVVLSPDHVEDLDGTIARLARVLQVGEGQIRERLARSAPPFGSVVVKVDASPDDVAALEARRLELPEASIQVVPLRSYPLAAAAAHALGRVGEVTDKQLQTTAFAGLEPGALVGQAGIEWQYNRQLMGKDGLRQVRVNSHGAEVEEAERRPPVDGPSLTLTLITELQTAMEQAFAGRSGSAIALDPETGEILAMTSTPAYDPNRFTTGIEPSLWARLTSDPETPLMNRVIQGQYAPGSTFKVVVDIAGLEEGVITPATSFFCPGYLSIYNTMFRCHKAEGHGMVNVHKALAQSCNVFHYQVGVRLEVDRIARYAHLLGLGATTGIDLPHETSGLVPSSEWKLKTQKTPWYAGETVSVAIGQGQTTVTPLQLARVAAVIANGGRLVQPHIVKAVGGEPLQWEPPKPLGLKPSTVQIVKEGMCAVVNDHGTGWRAQLPGFEVCGKTGSAQVVAHNRLQRNSTDPEMQPHGWFMCFAPADKPRIAMAVLVEHGVAGGASAAPVAREILARFFGVPTPSASPSPAPLRASIDREDGAVGVAARRP